MQKIKVGIVGCGSRIGHVLDLISREHKEIELVAMYDPNEESLRRTAASFNPQATVCRTSKELANLPEVDWVFIGSWNKFHCEQVIEALEAGKHVFCEKPLLTGFEQVRSVLKAARGYQGKFSFGIPLRYSTHVLKVKEIIDSGRIGKIISLEFNETLKFNHGGYIMADWRRLRKNAGTFILEKCCHDIDMINWILGSLPVKAASFGNCNFYLPSNAYHIDRLGRHSDGWEAYRKHFDLAPLNPFTSDKDIVDNQVAILEYGNGVRAAFHTNCNAGISERRSYFCGTEGALRHDINGGFIEVQRIGFDEPIERIETGVYDGHDSSDVPMAESVATTMLSGSSPEVGLHDALCASISCFGIDEAHDTSSVFDLRPFWDEVNISVADPFKKSHL